MISTRITLGRCLSQSLDSSTFKSNPSTLKDKKLILFLVGRCLANTFVGVNEGILYFHFFKIATIF